MKKLTHIPPEVVGKARENDLLTYLKGYEPQNLVHFGGNTDCTHEYDKLAMKKRLVPHILSVGNQFFYFFFCRLSYNSLKGPFLSKSSRKVPSSTILPASITKMRSAFSMVERRCATVTVVM